MASVPTPEQIRKLFQEFHTPAHVAEHCGMVERVSLFLGKKLKEGGVSIDLELLKSAALLHDIVRIVDFRVFEPEKFPFPFTVDDRTCWENLRAQYAGRHHAEVAAEILRQRGFPEIAEVIQKHRFLQIAEGFNSWEEKILYYADKRVKHHDIVPLKERLADGRKRNAPESIGLENTESLDQKVFALEEEICRATRIRPEELTTDNL